jgi:hypothetical protein
MGATPSEAAPTSVPSAPEPAGQHSQEPKLDRPPFIFCARATRRAAGFRGPCGRSVSRSARLPPNSTAAALSAGAASLGCGLGQECDGPPRLPHRARVMTHPRDARGCFVRRAVPTVSWPLQTRLRRPLNGEHRRQSLSQSSTICRVVMPTAPAQLEQALLPAPERPRP